MIETQKKYSDAEIAIIDDMYVSIMMSIENVKNGACIDKEFEWLHQFDELLKEKENRGGE